MTQVFRTLHGWLFDGDRDVSVLPDAVGQLTLTTWGFSLKFPDDVTQVVWSALKARQITKRSQKLSQRHALLYRLIIRTIYDSPYLIFRVYEDVVSSLIRMCIALSVTTELYLFPLSRKSIDTVEVAYRFSELSIWHAYQTRNRRKHDFHAMTNSDWHWT